MYFVFSICHCAHSGGEVSNWTFKCILYLPIVHVEEEEVVTNSGAVLWTFSKCAPGAKSLCITQSAFIIADITAKGPRSIPMHVPVYVHCIEGLARCLSCREGVMHQMLHCQG